MSLAIGIALTGMALCVCGMAWCIWALWCNERTHRERLLIIDAIFKQPNSQTYYALYQQVSNNDHFNARQRLKDPFSLYDPELRARVAAFIEKREAA